MYVFLSHVCLSVCLLSVWLAGCLCPSVCLSFSLCVFANISIILYEHLYVYAPRRLKFIITRTQRYRLKFIITRTPRRLKFIIARIPRRLKFIIARIPRRLKFIITRIQRYRLKFIITRTQRYRLKFIITRTQRYRLKFILYEHSVID